MENANPLWEGGPENSKRVGGFGRIIASHCGSSNAPIHTRSTKIFGEIGIYFGIGGGTEPCADRHPAGEQECGPQPGRA
jgi:hypothetical protein